ncbi:Transposase DDE domain protein [Gimesia panareensis]|uniref:Transposase DDE domain protein n=2 Tax=Gimesia panareensis TaxID=2527978 RepID=A0A518AEW8_9PLAN|nr:transposase [Gimesia panareensis]QDT25348.1 Transposase DDE domain protein [Gimesia panareensis]QDT25705.1 Transposase DDE domain protein [Gimesia panareensis]QDT26063.1 Transposase DDE domain protein [Gimesia panareensis]QDT28859.1 Transposase DDE domain protein [Gimesia panareensis]QDT29280.1 Transposase DDE domain protein [Gimesia panareensis]
MPHQDTEHLRINIQSMKAIFDRLIPCETSSLVRHGNASLDPGWLAAVAILCMGWTAKGTLGERVKTAYTVAGELFQVSTTVTRQGLMKALANYGQPLVDLVIQHLSSKLGQWKGYRTTAGKVTLAVDATKFSAPRSAANQREFAPGIHHRRSAKYRKKADESKALTVQLLTTVLWHLGSGLPFRWCIQGAAGSERIAAREMLESLPENVRLVGDAQYTGAPLWSAIMESGHSFLFRVGSNVTLLKSLGQLKIRDGFVYYWPDSMQRRDQSPLVLRLFQIHNGRNKIYLVSNELEMTDACACKLYRQRWGIEVFFRSVKQSCERSKLCCQTPVNVITELNWTLIGIWVALFVGKDMLHKQGTNLKKLSPIKVIRVFSQAVTIIACHAQQWAPLTDLLSQSVLAEEKRPNNRKASRGHPCKKRKRQCGKPTIIQATTDQKKLAKIYLE